MHPERRDESHRLIVFPYLRQRRLEHSLIASSRDPGPDEPEEDASCDDGDRERAKWASTRGTP